MLLEKLAHNQCRMHRSVLDMRVVQCNWDSVTFEYYKFINRPPDETNIIINTCYTQLINALQPYEMVNRCLHDSYRSAVNYHRPKRCRSVESVKMLLYNNFLESNKKLRRAGHLHRLDVGVKMHLLPRSNRL